MYIFKSYQHGLSKIASYMIELVYSPYYLYYKQTTIGMDPTQQPGSTHVSEMPFEQLFQIAEDKFNQLEYEEAQYFYDLAYQKKPQDEMLVMCYAHVLKANDKRDHAKQILEQSISNAPGGSYKRYFELAEIYDGEESITVFEKGIVEAKKSLANPFLSTTQEPEIKRDIAQAYASIAEICMTDLQHIPYNQLEAKCVEVLQAGKKIDPTCMDVHLQIANCMIEKDEYEQAKQELLIIKIAIMEAKEEYEDELVLQTAKYLMEVGEHQHSIDVLEKLNESQSNNPEVVYLLAFCAFNMGKFGLCQQYVQEYPEGQMIDEEVEDAMKELKVELAKKLKKGADETEEGMEEEEWMDVEEDEDIQ